METTKTTYEKLMDILKATESINTEIKDKLSYRVGKLIAKLKDKARDYSELVNDVNIDFCSLDKDKNIMKDNTGSLVFTQENQKKRNEEVKKISKKEVEVDFSNCICIDNTRVLKLPIHIIEELNGFLFNVSEDDFNEVEQKK